MLRAASNIQRPGCDWSPRARDVRAEVHLWHGHASNTESHSDLSILSTRERQRYERFRHRLDRVWYGAAHASIRRVLSGYVLAPSWQIALRPTSCTHCGASDHGPPIIARPQTGLRISIARSGARWALAIASHSAVGVDLEYPRPLLLDRLPSGVLTPAENSYLVEQNGLARTWAFYRLWTRKEAVLKALGWGLVADISRISVLPLTDWSANVEWVDSTQSMHLRAENREAECACVIAVAMKSGSKLRQYTCGELAY